MKPSSLLINITLRRKRGLSMGYNVTYQLEMLVMEAEQLGSLQAAIVDAVDYSPSASKEYLGALQQIEKLLRKHSTDLLWFLN